MAGITGVAYLCALAYRVGQMLRFGLPITFATVRLSDAAFAGLFVVVGGTLGVFVADLLESWRAGTADRLWRLSLWVAFSPVLLALAVLLLVTAVVLASLMGWPTALVLVGVAAAGLVWAIRDSATLGNGRAEVGHPDRAFKTPAFAHHVHGAGDCPVLGGTVIWLGRDCDSWGVVPSNRDDERGRRRHLR
ncbi:MAG: hypothetical protein Q8K99_10980 [Actinomycetota bacterium]|nr:hypothetical protein [Actinomycetota bacterium]